MSSQSPRQLQPLSLPDRDTTLHQPVEYCTWDRDVVAAREIPSAAGERASPPLDVSEHHASLLLHDTTEQCGGHAILFRDRSPP